MSPQPANCTLDNEAKKVRQKSGSDELDFIYIYLFVSSFAQVKLDSGSGVSSNSPNGRSRVVHLRNVPPDITEIELLHVCIPFGKVTNFLLLKGKSQVSKVCLVTWVTIADVKLTKSVLTHKATLFQAFVEYEDENSAVQLVAVSCVSPINLRGRTVFCQYSNHQELKTDKQQSNLLAVSTNGTSVGGGNQVWKCKLAFLNDTQWCWLWFRIRACRWPYLRLLQLWLTEAIQLWLRQLPKLQCRQW